MPRYLSLTMGLIGVAALLGACGAASSGSSGSNPPPTVAAFFDPSQRVERPTATRLPTATRRPTRTPDPLATPTPPRRQIVDLVIYDETLDPGWSVANSWGVTVELTSTAHVYTGAVAISVTTLEDYGAIFFTVLPDAQRAYPTSDVVGVSLWLSGGDGPLMPEDLAVSFVGSNEYPYWLRGDTSVQAAEQSPFSETRLSFLGFDRSLPPGAWKDAVVWIDRLLYEPDYTYVTGFYVKSDRDFRQTYYIDRVALLVQEPAAP
jgi:hypothetical protein